MILKKYFKSISLVKDIRHITDTICAIFEFLAAHYKVFEDFRRSPTAVISSHENIPTAKNVERQVERSQKNTKDIAITDFTCMRDGDLIPKSSRTTFVLRAPITVSILQKSKEDILQNSVTLSEKIHRSPHHAKRCLRSDNRTTLDRQVPGSGRFDEQD